MNNRAIGQLTNAVPCDHLRRMDWKERADWLAREVLPSEADVRQWLARSIRGISSTDIDDVIQECYARLWQLDHTRIMNARAYFFTLARNVVGEMLRRSRVVSIAAAFSIDWLTMEGESVSTETHLSEGEDFERLRQAIAKLPPKCRRVFGLRTFEGLSQREIAERTGLAESTVEKHLSKGLRLVMQEMRNAPPVATRMRHSDETRRTKSS